MKRSSISAVLAKDQTIHYHWRWERQMWVGLGSIPTCSFPPEDKLGSVPFTVCVQLCPAEELSSRSAMRDCSTAKGSHRQDSSPRNWLKFSFHVLPHYLYLEL